MITLARKPSEAALHRLPPLSRLPVFLDLKGKRAIVAGGTAGALWKAELLAASGADVQIYTDAPTKECHELVARGAAAGSLTLIAEHWSAAAFAGAAIAVGDCEDDIEAEAFLTAAHSAGVPCNTIDRRATCDFEFGAIVNRSPVVIGISTDGAAPILGQAIRRRIETLLPPSLAHWAGFARAVRAQVMVKLKGMAQRRIFWERVSDEAFAGGKPPEDARAIEQMIEQAASGSQARSGRVTLVGAGPGDAEYLTLKAVRALQSADVILFDDLVSGDVLELARREAKRMMVGKRARSPSCSQSDINALILKLALQGKHVVRLKSGDPAIFGRAGEEIEELRNAGIGVEMVPGITTASALAARIGVSLTHRDCAQSVRFVTGHARTGELPGDLDWRGLADGRTSLVFYMAGRTSALIAARLLEHGLESGTPVVVAQSVAREGETYQCLTLGALAKAPVVQKAGAPVILCIGAAFRHAALPKVELQHEPSRLAAPQLQRTA